MHALVVTGTICSAMSLPFSCYLRNVITPLADGVLKTACNDPLPIGHCTAHLTVYEVHCPVELTLLLLCCNNIILSWDFFHGNAVLINRAREHVLFADSPPYSASSPLEQSLPFKLHIAQDTLLPTRSTAFIAVTMPPHMEDTRLKFSSLLMPLPLLAKGLLLYIHHQGWRNPYFHH